MTISRTLTEKTKRSGTNFNLNGGIFKYSYNIKKKEGWVKLLPLTKVGDNFFEDLYNVNSNIIKQEYHITVVRGESIPNMKVWNRYNNCLINFEIDKEIKSNGIYYWIDIQCPFLYIVRQELDLNLQPKYPFHLTIAKSK